jgi:hypothetical protein
MFKSYLFGDASGISTVVAFFRFAASRTFILRGLAILLIFDVSDTSDWLSSRLTRIRCPILIFLLPAKPRINCTL